MKKGLQITLASVYLVTIIVTFKPVIGYADWSENNNGSWSYIDQSTTTSGWKQIQSKWYFFDKNGIMQTGWVMDGINWYYMNENGVMQTGIIAVDQKKYILDLSGKMLIGNVTYQNKDYKIGVNGDIITEDKTSIYKKLANHEDIRILIVGDSIGAEASKESDRGGWVCRLQDYLKSKYNCKVSITNLSYYGTTTEYGYNKLINNDITNYDLAFICFGVNDSSQKMSVEQFKLNYEHIIKEIKDKNSSCDIIPIVESTFREYNDFIKVIMNLSDSNGLSYADTIKAFKNSGMKYSELSSDTVHPNDKGYKLYFETVSSLIDSKVD